MSLKEISLKKAYDSDTDDILNEFYIPVLSQSISYKRLAGFFSSSSFAVAARGISRLVLNGGKMELITGAKLQHSDIEMIKKAYENPEEVIAKIMIKDLENLEDEFVKDHVRALGWMIANGKLDIRVAIIYDDNGYPLESEEVERRGVFHQKVGIFEDGEGNKVSFSGSDNESASAWVSNIEEFKVFRSWIEAEKEYVEADLKKFRKFWDGYASRVRVIEIPVAIKEKLIEIAPENIEDLSLDRWYRKSRVKRKIKLWEHQNDAVERWLANNKKGIFAMATGVGKTIAALECLRRSIEEEKQMVVVIACPYDHLCKQWEREMDKFGISIDTIIADSSNPNWKNEVADYLYDIESGNKENLVIITTYNTFSSPDFIKILRITKKKRFLIADEVHAVGAPIRREGLIEDYDFRLGLSATPKRWLDLEGTRIIYDYFGGEVFDFGLKEAIEKGYLVPFSYFPRFVSLQDEELENYLEITRRIVKQYYRKKENSEEEREIIETLLFKRAGIVKNAKAKYDELKKILDEIGTGIRWTIIYTSPEQIDQVMQILGERNIRAHRFTMEESTKPDDKHNGLSEREYILQKFEKGEFQVLVAMRCLDEGVDIPPARTTILMASSGNPREYIQRIGRILRRYQDKDKGVIYDLVVVPLFSRVAEDLRDWEEKIFEKELRRYEEIVDISENKFENIKLLYELKKKLNC